MRSDIKVSKITSQFNKGDWDIHVSGYDNDGKNVQLKEKMKDYFYYDAKHISDIDEFPGLKATGDKLYSSVDGKDLLRVYYTSIKNKNKLVKKHIKRSYQADLSPEFKFILDNNLEWSTKRHFMYLDIETWYDPNDSSQNRPDSPNMPITSIVAYSSEAKKYFVFSWHPEKTKDLEKPKFVEKDNVTYVFCKTEQEVLMGFIKLVESSNPDILSGWYSSGYDMPYILNRAQRLGLPVEDLSPVKDYYIKKRGDYWKFQIKGLDHIDMMEALKDLKYNLPNWKLATAAKVILKDEEFGKLTAATWKDWLDDYEGFLKYAVRDVEILKEINEKVQVFDLYISMQQIANLQTLNMVFFKSMLCDNYMCKEFHNKTIFPTRYSKRRRDYQGAIVIDPTEPGLNEDVTVMDYTSLYPTTMMAFNISPETFICSQEQCEKGDIDIEDVVQQLKDDNIDYVDTGYSKDLFGRRYLFYGHTHKVGIIPQILKKIFVQRVEINRKLKAGEYPEDQVEAMTKRQWSYKIIMNSAYGAMGYSLFRMCLFECADAITFFARQALKFGLIHFNEKGHKPLYADTDSVFIKSNGKDEAGMKGMQKEYNESLYENFVKKHNTGPVKEFMFLDLKFEYYLDRIYFGEVKKRYYGIVKGSGYKVIRGMNIIRKETPEFLKQRLNDMAELAVTNKLTLDWVLNLRKEVESQPYQKIGMAKGFGKPFNTYKKTMPQHVKAAVWANDILGTELTNMDNPYLFYVKSKLEDDKKVKERHKAICINEDDLHLIDQNNDKFEIDYDILFYKQCIVPVEEFKQMPYIEQLLEKYNETISS